MLLWCICSDRLCMKRLQLLFILQSCVVNDNKLNREVLMCVIRPRVRPENNVLVMSSFSVKTFLDAGSWISVCSRTSRWFTGPCGGESLWRQIQSYNMWKHLQTHSRCTHTHTHCLFFRIWIMTCSLILTSSYTHKSDSTVWIHQ